MVETINKNYPISWHELHRDARALAWRLLDMEQKFMTVVAITRGGLVPAAIVARELNIRLIDTICVSSYDHKNLRSAKILKSIASDGEDHLIIDDLTDTGGTANIVREILPKAHFATIYAKPEGKPYVDSYVTEVSQDTWILFPWDVELTYQKPFSEKK